MKSSGDETFYYLNLIETNIKLIQVKNLFVIELQTIL
jgi:hypothetical protein